MKNDLKKIALNLRILSLRATTQAGSGHPTSCLSAADIVASIFFYAMRYNIKKPDYENNDRFILSKGHASPLLYAAWQQSGVITFDELLQMRRLNSPLEGHPTPEFKYVEAATGSLGMGLSIGAGMSIYAKMEKLDFKTFVLLGDAEIAEGSIWEAAEISAFYKLNNLIAIVDDNRLGQSTQTMDAHDTKKIAQKFKAFGWDTKIIDGHDIDQICKALSWAKRSKAAPSMIIAKTLKGFGLDNVEDKQGYHGKAFSKEELPKLIENLKKRFPIPDYEENFDESFKIKKPKKINIESEKQHKQMINFNDIKLEPMMATRKAYGIVLEKLGSVNNNVVALDGDVKNSTFSEIFANKFPDRFIECFVAEQNMVSMAEGLALRGKIPFVSTFASFFSRAHDQIRMAAIGRAKLKLVGSHAGVSIGQDGPSQMGLEDMGIMRALPNSIVLYPADFVSTAKLVFKMAEYQDGIAYLRTTRSETPTIYALDDEFEIGGCKILKKSDTDKACIIGAGITLFEGLKAYKMLKEEGIMTSVVDCYSVKPLPARELKLIIRESENKALVVEDHYIQGGLSEAICHEMVNDNFEIITLAVKKIPHSGSKEELMRTCQIDAQAIYENIKKLLAK